MIEHRCSIGTRGGFFQRLRTGTYPGHILEHVTLELQTLAGTEVGFGKARETSEQGVYRVVIEYIEETVGRECLAVARELVLAAIHDRPFNVGKEIERLRELAQASVSRAEHPRHHPSGRGPQHPLPAAEYREPGAVRSRPEAAPHSGGRDGPHQRHRRGDCPRQGNDPHVVARRGRADALRPAGQGRRRRLGHRLRHRRAGGRQTAGRQPGPRRGHQPHDPRADRRRLRSGAEGKRVGAGREVCPRPRLSAVGRGRSGGGRRPARARPSPRRRHPHRGPIDRAGQRRSPPRRAPRHRVEQDQARRGRAGGAGRSRVHARFGAAGRLPPC